MENGNKAIQDTYVVGIGASAGGLEALEAFFQKAPVDAGLTFVVVQHLSPDFKSLMDELLARHTQMAIERVDSEVKIHPNRIYLIPPKMHLTLNGRRLIPTDYSPNLQLRLPIDHFFTSLAEYGSRAIGVILSGTGSDGTRGATAIREAGGFVIAQDPRSCRFDGMPSSVIRHGAAQRILLPDEIPGEILNYVAQDESMLLNSNGDLDKETVSKLEEILQILKSVDGIDFVSYRQTTLVRRIERRIKLHELECVDDYIDLLKKDQTEVSELNGELLIGVTSFFRDKECFDMLAQEVIPEICERDPEKPIRVWVAGCSTGEEAYSLSMLFYDYFEKSGKVRDLKIFATDVDRESLTIAPAGIFSADAVENVPPDFLSRFFVPTDKSYTIKSYIRKSILFSYHNVVKDPPFTKLDLVTCRNLLIYFQTNLQLKAMSMFHFGLLPQGHLFLGRSETLGEIAEEFDTVSALTKVFRKKRNVRLALSEFALDGNNIGDLQKKHSPRQPILQIAQPQADVRLFQIYEKLLNEFVPASLLIDEKLSILHVFGSAHEFLQIVVGRTSFEIAKMLPREFVVAISAAAGQASRSNQQVVFKDITTRINGEERTFEITVRPANALVARTTGSFIVFFRERVKKNKAVEPTETISFKMSEHVTVRITDLEEQLRVTRETLQSTIEELETTNEELQSTNEELMSSNEELQSANEELHSVNEELYTVNTEYQNKIRELTEANNDIDFLVRSSKMGIVFLESDLSIRRFTPGIGQIISLRDHDIGRPISELTFKYDHNLIVKMIEKVAKTGNATSREVVAGNITFLITAMNYESSEEIPKNRDRSLVLSIIDVTPVKEAEELRRSADDLEQFNYVVSHDLQKPISRLNMDVKEICEETHSPEELVDLKKSSLSNILKLRYMLEILLDYSRIRTKGVPFQEYTASEIIREAARRAHLPKNTLTFNVSEVLYVDKEQAIRVFQMLFENCVRHSGRGKDLVIAVQSKVEGNHISLSVSDNGKGIRHEDQADLFRIFNQLHNNPTPEHLGIGLAFVKRIVERHHGATTIRPASASQAWGIEFTLPGEQLSQ